MAFPVEVEREGDAATFLFRRNSICLLNYVSNGIGLFSLFDFQDFLEERGLVCIILSDDLLALELPPLI